MANGYHAVPGSPVFDVDLEVDGVGRGIGQGGQGRPVQRRRVHADVHVTHVRPRRVLLTSHTGLRPF
jgi:hypothetical protein